MQVVDVIATLGTGPSLPAVERDRAARAARAKHGSFRKYLSEFVYGGMDGCVTTFAVVAGATGGGLDTPVILILGAANLLADGFAMSIGAYLSAKASDHLERAEERVQERRIADPNRKAPVKVGVATLISFVVMGALPLACYLWDHLIGFAGDLFLWSSVVTGGGFVTIGLLRARVVRTNRWKGALETLVLGALAALVAYYVGDLVEHVVKGA